jgi:hypothetical protein
MQQSHSQLDEFLDRGADVLSNLGQQRELLKGVGIRFVWWRGGRGRISGSFGEGW